MDSNNPIGYYISISEIYPEVENNFITFKNYLCDISRTDAIFMCARINKVLTHYETKQIEGQQFIMKLLMSDIEIDALKRAVLKRESKKNIVVFFRGQVLELLRWIILFCEDKSGDGETFNLQEIKSKFLKALLMASDIWAKRVFVDWNFENEDLDIKKKIVLGSFRKSIEDQSLAPELEKSLGRGWSLFNEYLPRYFSSFKELFQSEMGLSIEDYYSCLTAIIPNFMTLNNTGIFNIDKIQNVSNTDVLQKFYTIEVQSIDALHKSIWGDRYDFEDIINNIPDYNYRPLREKPIIKSNDGRAIIIDSIFFSEKASIGPLFHVLNKACGSEIFTYFGYAFEDYTKDVLNRMFNYDSDLFAKRLETNVFIKNEEGKKLEIDACLNDVTEMVLFEIKAVFLDESSILTNKSERLIEKLRVRYGVSSDGIKGVGQLARLIDTVEKKKHEPLENIFDKVKVIYPVLLVHDTYMNTPLFGEFLSNEFREALLPDAIITSGGMRKGSIVIKDLILMTIDELENLETSIQSFGFRDFLSDYSADCKDRKNSINNYIAFSKYKNKIRHNKNLASIGCDIFDRTMKTFFDNN